MQIQINKNFETEYKDDVWKGFDGRETITIAVAVTISIIICYCLYKYAHIPLELVIYIAIPVVLPILLVGIYKYQDMSIWELIKEIIYEDEIRILCWDAGEYDYPVVQEEKPDGKGQRKVIRMMRREHKNRLKVHRKEQKHQKLNHKGGVQK